MRQLLRPIEIAGIILILLGIIAAFIWGNGFGAWLCGIGMLLWVIVVVYKACHWTEYERDNRQNIKLMLLATILIIVQLLLKVWSR